MTRGMKRRRLPEVWRRAFVALVHLVSMVKNLHLFDALLEPRALYNLRRCASASKDFAQFVVALVTPRGQLCDQIWQGLMAPPTSFLLYSSAGFAIDIRTYFSVRHAVYNDARERTGFLTSSFYRMVRVTLVCGGTRLRVFVNGDVHSGRNLHRMPGESIEVTPRYDPEGRVRYELDNHYLAHRRFQDWEALREALRYRRFGVMPARLELEG